jgi:hypothetical protein
MRLLEAAAVLLVALGCSSSGEAGEAGRSGTAPIVRQPAVAGLFYPGDADELARTVDGLLQDAAEYGVEGSVVSGVVPHAGYAYSGRVAASFYRILEGREYDLVFLVCPSHHVAFRGFSVFGGDAYETPLGEVPVATDVCRRLTDSDPDASFVPAAHSDEHAIEVQLPFLQRVLPEGFEIVPIVVGNATEDQLAFMAELMLAEASGRRTLVIASSDLSHYPPDSLAREVDRETVDCYLEGDPGAMLYRTLYEPMPPGVSTFACGGVAMALVLSYDRIYPGVGTGVIEMANSADAGADPSEVVGYAAIVSESPFSDPAQWSLDDGDREILLGIAVSSVESAVTGGGTVVPETGGDGDLELPRGVFVTLRENGALRGCIGTIRPVEPLASAVRDMAEAAALEDPRFRPVTPEELPALEYEVSVLSPLQILPDWHDAEVGRDGLLIISDRGSGLLLPQVPVEMGWDLTGFMEGLCTKAGLPVDAYTGDVVLYRFQAEVFGTDDLED